MYQRGYFLLMLIVLLLSIASISKSMTSVTKINERNEIPSLNDILAANVNSNGTWKNLHPDHEENAMESEHVDKDESQINESKEEEEEDRLYNPDSGDKFFEMNTEENIHFDHYTAEDKYFDLNIEEDRLFNLNTEDDRLLNTNLVPDENSFKESEKFFLSQEKPEEEISNLPNLARNEMPSLEDVLTENVHSNGTWITFQTDSSNNSLHVNNENQKDEDLTNNNAITEVTLSGPNSKLDNLNHEDENNEIGDTEQEISYPFGKEKSMNLPSLAKDELPSLEDILATNIHLNGTWKDNNSSQEFTVESGVNFKDRSYCNDVVEDEEIDVALRDEIIRNLPHLIKEGVQNAEKILDDNKKAREDILRDPKRKLFVPTSSHARKVDAESRDVGYCQGLAMAETTKLIVERYNITNYKIPAILTSIPIAPYLGGFRTKYCQNNKRQVDSTRCDPNSPYRTITGRCNNLNPTFIERGASNTPFARFLKAQYADGFNSMRGDNLPPFLGLPNARVVSRLVSLITDPPSDIHMTQMLKAWGQFIDHDVSFTLEGAAANCCDFGFDSPASTSPECRAIDVKGDPFFSQFNVQCLHFVRNVAGGSVLGVREQVNIPTAFVDASMIYGSTVTKANELRAFVDGRLRENARGEDGTCSTASHCNMPFLPERPNSSPALLFNAGDPRVNEQPGLIAVHTLFFRFHNKIADELKKKHREFDDTMLYEETRRIVIAVVQHITYNEFLPLLLGKSYANEFKLYSLASGFFTGYEPTFDPSIRNVFATAAFRIGHTLIGKFISGKKTISLETAFNRGILMTEDTDMFPSHVLKGECTNPSERYDVEIVDAVVNKLMTQSPFTHGSDLVALNIQRGRDHALPPYNEWRRFCGKAPFATFDQMKQELNPSAVDIFKRLYRSVEDVDIFPGGLAEFRTTFGFIGDTFSCIMARQFHLLKHADRFWYEYNGQPKPFTEAQLSVIRNSSLASVICSASAITTIQPFPMLSPQLRRNEERKCADFLPTSIISQIARHW